MGEARVKAELWVQAMLRTASSLGRPGVLLRRGDADAGGVLLVLRGRAGLRVLSQIRAADGRAAWLAATGPTPVDEQVADQYVARQIGFDPDLWVVEFEAPDLTPPFAAHIIT